MVDNLAAVTKPMMRLDTFSWRLLDVGSQVQTAEELELTADFEQGHVVERADQGVSSRNPDTTLNHLGNPNRPCRGRRAAARSRRQVACGDEHF